MCKILFSNFVEILKILRTLKLDIFKTFEYLIYYVQFDFFYAF